MKSLLEQRYAIKFHVKLDKPGKETHDMIKKAYSDAALIYRAFLSSTSYSERDRSGVFE